MTAGVGERDSGVGQGCLSPLKSRYSQGLMSSAALRGDFHPVGYYIELLQSFVCRRVLGTAHKGAAETGVRAHPVYGQVLDECGGGQQAAATLVECH